MKRLLIVDDEHHIVNWLAELFGSCQELDLEIMKVYSGVETLQLLQTYRMDLILLDIQMPGMSGLAVAEKALADWPSTRIIFLTAYENFDYLYRANHLPGTSYLLKTEPDEKIISEVRKVLDQVEEESHRQLVLERAKREKLLLEHLLWQDVLRELVHGTGSFSPAGIPAASFASPGFPPADFSSANVDGKGKMAPFELEKPLYLMYSQVTGGPFYDQEARSYERIISYLNIVSSLMFGKFSFSMLEMEKNSMLWFFQDCRDGGGESPLPALSLLRNMAEDMGPAVERVMHSTLLNLLFEDAVMADEIPTVFRLLSRRCTDCLRQNLSDTSSCVTVSFQDHREWSRTEETQSVGMDSAAISQELSYYLFQKDRESFMKLLHTVSRECCSHKSMHDLAVVQLYFSVSMLLVRYISQYRLDNQLALKTALYPLYYIHDFSDWKSAFRYLSTLSGHLFELISDTENSRNEQLILRMERYVRENISHPLSISDVASCVNYNATYISRLYKQLRGITLSEYITQTRLGRATELLLTTNLSIQNIATETGFDTSQYFSMVFKKGTGISPREFRNQHLAQNPGGGG